MTISIRAGYENLDRRLAAMSSSPVVEYQNLRGFKVWPEVV